MTPSSTPSSDVRVGLLSDPRFQEHVAAQARQAGVERVLVYDWDLHHGNGTQAIFYTDPSVLYASTHQFPFYPGTGSEEETGEGAGQGFTLNAPLDAGSGDAEVLTIVD